ncbi:Endonuclease/exonuclease/phosphatase [Blastocladiella britannica]|nr:Endonuclease/exonuclease/phosphatase [Blastocladiella britannica]
MSGRRDGPKHARIFKKSAISSSPWPANAQQRIARQSLQHMSDADAAAAQASAEATPLPPSPTLASALVPPRREWVALEQPTTATETTRVRIMCYNILAQNLLEKNRYLYKPANTSFLDWYTRLEKVMAHIKVHGPDVVCLQEVHVDDLAADLAPAFAKLGYSYAFKQRTQTAEAHMDGLATFWRRDRWALAADPVPVEYRTNAFLDRDNVGLIVPLVAVVAEGEGDSSSASAAARIIVANTHLLFNPKRGAVKIGQAHQLLASMASLIDGPLSESTGSVPPVVVVGDFNSAPGSASVSFMVDGTIDLSPPESELSGQSAKHKETVDPPRSHSILNRPVLADPLTPHSAAQRIAIRGTNVPRFLVHPFDLASAYPVSELLDKLSSCSARSRDLVDYIFSGTYGAVVRPSPDVGADSAADSAAPDTTADVPVSVHPRRWVPATWSTPLGALPAPTDAVVPAPGQEWVPPPLASREERPTWELVPVGVLRLPTWTDAVPIPNATEGSDHFSLIADFALIRKE